LCVKKTDSEVKRQQEQKKEAENLIDKDNLKDEESVGTFRWNNSTALINTPPFENSMRQILLKLKDGWKTYA